MFKFPLAITCVQTLLPVYAGMIFLKNPRCLVVFLLPACAQKMRPTLWMSVSQLLKWKLEKLLHFFLNGIKIDSDIGQMNETDPT